MSNRHMQNFKFKTMSLILRIIINDVYYKYEVQLQFYVNIIKKTAPVGAKIHFGKNKKTQILS